MKLSASNSVYTMILVHGGGAGSNCSVGVSTKTRDHEALTVLWRIASRGQQWQQ